MVSYGYWAYWVVPQITHPPFYSSSNSEVSLTPSSPLVAHQISATGTRQSYFIPKFLLPPGWLLSAPGNLIPPLLALQFHPLACPLWTRMMVGGPLDSFQAIQVYSILLIISKFSPDTIDTIKPIDYLHRTSVKWGTIWCLPSHWWL